MKEWITIFHANSTKKRTGADLLTKENIDFMSKTVTRDKEYHYTIKKESYLSEDYNNFNYICIHHQDKHIN